ncbi:hypothetical protein A2348_04760 [Candidatus Uhrbacteria bacterium RIFOXYB12_FULL_58_10]|uniref:Uncharacterized protein n=1 Tax=Candidatus Uhrbacteria bacterium RIFOXYB2_FULL_57_15 TaxID=1802422 RepID=A0A1F7W8N7_9BACT|nr:MAG: hypothetical protein A2348_04760 [Candidatus Uhrbacteria bacterium RIFOXYB12_FULL_58_10]OGL99140.1 MAG: hypothetical protein A2304_03230 [Candidatus Uhrbacteria bacterium RIFOXYB2_FULL_57_15]
MSAETKLDVVRMENGEYWIVIRSTGDTEIECNGACGPLRKCATYEEAEGAFAAMSDEDSEDYEYTEYGGRMPSRKELESAPPRFLWSQVKVGFGTRKCGCLDHRDIGRQEWWVREYTNVPFDEDPEDRARVIGENLTYAEAVTLASTYATEQPGECQAVLPTHFRAFRDYDRHDCWGHDSDYWRLCLPRAAPPDPADGGFGS